MDNKKELLKTNLPIIIGFVTAETIIYLGRGEDEQMANYMALIVALITVAGSILANFFQYKKDSNRIGEVKEDTSAIKPNVENIRELSKETNDYVTKAVSPDIKKMLEGIHEIQKGDMKENLTMLAEDLKYRRRLEESYRGSNSREILVSGIDELYEDNARLKLENEKTANVNRELVQTIERKNIQIEELEHKNERLEERIKELSPKRSERDFQR